MTNKKDDFIEHLKKIHYSFREVLDKKEYDKAAEMLNSFTEDNDVNEIYTALIITQSFKDHEILKEPIRRASDIVEKKIKKERDERE